MMTQEENDLLTRTGPGTPCGELLRRYWQPAALSQELPPGGAPKPVRLLGEDLVLFRDDQGRPGLLAIHCSHRGADLSYGRVEDGGLRCIYHGWLYDIHGRCLDQPGELGGGEHRDTIRHPAHPCQERGGAIFAYLGPGEPPLLPNYEFLTAPAENRHVMKFLLECNFLQGLEGSIDPVHLSFLHRNFQDSHIDRNYKAVRGSEASRNTLFGRDVSPTLDVELTDLGMRIYSVRKSGPDKAYLRVSNFVYPNFAAFPGPTAGYGYSVNWHVAVDDTHHLLYGFLLARGKPIPEELIRQEQSELTPDYRLKRNPGNRYLQDREAVKNVNYTGIGLNFRCHDALATETMGPRQDRTQEHLVSSDKTIVAARKLLLNAMKEVEEGEEAPHVVRDPQANRFPQLVVISEAIPSATDWREYTKKTEAHASV